MTNANNVVNIDQMTVGSASETSVVGLAMSEASSNPLSEMNNFKLATNVSNNAQVDIKEFIYTQLKENIRDRLFMLNVERDLINFLKNDKEENYKFQAMNPYYRMLTHRICDYFGLGHNLDNLKQSVIVFKIADQTRMPLVNFQTIINTSTITNGSQSSKENQVSSSDGNGSASRSGSSSSSAKSLTPNTSSNNLTNLQQEQKIESVVDVKIEKKQILKRDSNDQENEALRNKQLLNKRSSDIRPKTFEEKSAEYNRIKNRIFNNIDDNNEASKPAPQSAPTPVQKQTQAQNSNQQSEIKQYKILNRPNKSFQNDLDNEIKNANFSTENANTQQIDQVKNHKKNLNQNIKPKQNLQNEKKNSNQQFKANQNYNTNKNNVAQNLGSFRPNQIAPPFPPQQYFFINQNPNFNQFGNNPMNQVMYPRMTSQMIPSNTSFQMISNQNPGLLMPTQVQPFLQIPQNNPKSNPVRPSPKTHTPKYNSPMTKKPQVSTNTINKIKNIKFQVYNLSANLTRAKLNELLGPYIYKMEIFDKKNNKLGQDNDENKNGYLDETSIDILIEFENFDKLEDAFKDLNLDATNQQLTNRPFLIKPAC